MRRMERFETWVEGGMEGNRIKILVYLTISIAVIAPNKSGHMLLLIIQLSGNRGQVMNSNSDNLGS